MGKGKIIQALNIDSQKDFCESNGSLHVKGAKEDCGRAATMITRLGKRLSKIYSTFDSHYQYQS